MAPRFLPAGTPTVSTTGAPTSAAATRCSLFRSTAQAVTANVHSAKAVASTIVVRVPPGRRATWRSARNRPMLPRVPVLAKADRQASGSSREAITAMASPSNPGTSRPRAPCRADPIWPVTARSSRPAAAPVARTASATQPRPAGLRPDRRHSSTTGRRKVRRAASTTASRPPAVARPAVAQASGGSGTAVPGRSSTRLSAAVAAHPARVPIGRAAASSSTGSDIPNTIVRQPPRPRSLARDTSWPRASIASVTDRKSSSRQAASSCSVISTTGISTARQLVCTAWSVAGMAVLTSTCCCCSAAEVLKAVMPDDSWATSLPVTRDSFSRSSTTAVPCCCGGACSRVARGVKKASIGLMAEK